jgi:carotenoid cleavage dioxygenase-like enzyme
MSTLYPSYYHSFAITDKTLVFFEMPLKMNLLKFFTAAYRSGQSFASAMEWNADLKVRVYTRACQTCVQTRIHVRNMRTGAPLNDIVYTADPMFTFHHGNSYERDDCIVLDFVACVSAHCDTNDSKMCV